MRIAISGSVAKVNGLGPRFDERALPIPDCKFRRKYGQQGVNVHAVHIVRAFQLIQNAEKMGQSTPGIYVTLF